MELLLGWSWTSADSHRTGKPAPKLLDYSLANYPWLVIFFSVVHDVVSHPEPPTARDSSSKLSILTVSRARRNRLDPDDSRFVIDRKAFFRIEILLTSR
jgi:hypothetical protein